MCWLPLQWQARTCAQPHSLAGDLTWQGPGLRIRPLKLPCNARTLHGSHGSAKANRAWHRRHYWLYFSSSLCSSSGGSVAGMDIRQTGEPGTGDGASASGSLSRPATPSDPHTSGPNTPTGTLGHSEGGHPAKGTHGLQIPNRHSTDAIDNTSWGSAPNPGVYPPLLNSLQCCAWHAAVSLPSQGAGTLGPSSSGSGTQCLSQEHAAYT